VKSVVTVSDTVTISVTVMVTVADHISHDTDVGKYMACFFRMSHTRGILLGIQKSYE
jgi:hypothetical protein